MSSGTGIFCSFPLRPSFLPSFRNFTKKMNNVFSDAEYSNPYLGRIYRIKSSATAYKLQLLLVGDMIYAHLTAQYTNIGYMQNSSEIS